MNEFQLPALLPPHAWLYVDGSSGPKDSIGAWAAVAACGEKRQFLYSIDYPTTVSRCELRPIIEGLRWIKRNWARGSGFRVRVTSDSEYTVKSLCGVYPREKNTDLWAAADDAAKTMNVDFVWRERNSLPYMTLCDQLCGTLRLMMVDRMTAATKGNPLHPELSFPLYSPEHEAATNTETENNAKE